MAKNITVTKMNSQIENGKSGFWSKHTCKESALVGRAKKLAPKVNSICKILELEPNEMNVEFSNAKPVGGVMFDSIKLFNEEMTINVEFHNASKNEPGYVEANLNGDHAIEAPNWKELKSMLPEWFQEANVNKEIEEEDEIEECDGDCDECDTPCEDVETEEEEEEVEAETEEEEEEAETEEEDKIEELGVEPTNDEPEFEDELDENPYADED